MPNNCFAQAVAGCRCAPPGQSPNDANRCGNPFTFGESDRFLDPATKQLVADPHGCRGVDTMNVTRGCSGGIFV